MNSGVFPDSGEGEDRVSTSPSGRAAKMLSLGPLGKLSKPVKSIDIYGDKRLSNC